MQHVKTEPTTAEGGDEQQQMAQPAAAENNLLPNCYCGNPRELGTIELQCVDCGDWFHQNCLRDIEYSGALPFMVSYVFQCQNCSEDGEEHSKFHKSSFSSVTIMALANLAFQQPLQEFFTLAEIVEFMKKNWKSLSKGAKPRGKKWQQKILEILQINAEHFETDSTDDNAFALNEKDLLKIGPKFVSGISMKKNKRVAATRTTKPTERFPNPKQAAKNELPAGETHNGQNDDEPMDLQDMLNAVIQMPQQQQNGVAAVHPTQQLQFGQKNLNNNSRPLSRTTTGGSFASRVPSQLLSTPGQAIPTIQLEDGGDEHFFSLLDHRTELDGFARKHSFDIYTRASDASITFEIVFYNTNNHIKQELSAEFGPSTSAASMARLPAAGPSSQQQHQQKSIVFTDKGPNMHVRKLYNNVLTGEVTVPKFEWEFFAGTIKGMCQEFLSGQQ